MPNLLIDMPINYEPLKKNRFLVRFPSSMGINEWWVQTAQRPNYTANEVEIPFLNTSKWVLGRYVWEPITITFRDPIGPSATQALIEWVRLHSESLTGRQGYAAGYKKDFEIDLLDPTGATVQRWKVFGGMITNMNNGDLGYSDDSLADITLTIRPDYCENVF